MPFHCPPKDTGTPSLLMLSVVVAGSKGLKLVGSGYRLSYIYQEPAEGTLAVTWFNADVPRFIDKNIKAITINCTCNFLFISLTSYIFIFHENCRPLTLTCAWYAPNRKPPYCGSRSLVRHIIPCQSVDTIKSHPVHYLNARG